LGLPAEVRIAARIVPSLGQNPVTGKFERSATSRLLRSS
jgi:hypothetical protein